MQKLKAMKESLMACVQGQMSDLKNVDAKELGEAIDMIKDLEEAIYYKTITEAMEKKEHEGNGNGHYPSHVTYYTENKMWQDPRYDREHYGRMYYDGNGNGASMNYTNGNGGNGSKGFYEKEYPMIRDYREGRSPEYRRNYMEHKEMHNDKATRIKELEGYMTELGKDLTEMIEGTSPEERQLMERKISALATKIGQVNV